MLKHSFYFGVKLNRGEKIINFDSLHHRLCTVNFIGLMPTATPEMGTKSGPTGSLCRLVREV